MKNLVDVSIDGSVLRINGVSVYLNDGRIRDCQYHHGLNQLIVGTESKISVFAPTLNTHSHGQYDITQSDTKDSTMISIVRGDDGIFQYLNDSDQQDRLKLELVKEWPIYDSQVLHVSINDQYHGWMTDCGVYLYCIENAQLQFNKVSLQGNAEDSMYSYFFQLNPSIHCEYLLLLNGYAMICNIPLKLNKLFKADYHRFTLLNVRDVITARWDKDGHLLVHTKVGQMLKYQRQDNKGGDYQYVEVMRLDANEWRSGDYDIGCINSLRLHRGKLSHENLDAGSLQHNGDAEDDSDQELDGDLVVIMGDYNELFQAVHFSFNSNGTFLYWGEPKRSQVLIDSSSLADGSVTQDLEQFQINQCMVMGLVQRLSFTDQQDLVKQLCTNPSLYIGYKQKQYHFRNRAVDSIGNYSEIVFSVAFEFKEDNVPLIQLSSVRYGQHWKVNSIELIAEGLFMVRGDEQQIALYLYKENGTLQRLLTAQCKDYKISDGSLYLRRLSEQRDVLYAVKDLERGLVKAVDSVTFGSVDSIDQKEVFQSFFDTRMNGQNLFGSVISKKCCRNVCAVMNQKDTSFRIDVMMLVDINVSQRDIKLLSCLVLDQMPQDYSIYINSQQEVILAVLVDSKTLRLFELECGTPTGYQSDMLSFLCVKEIIFGHPVNSICVTHRDQLVYSLDSSLFHYNYNIAKSALPLYSPICMLQMLRFNCVENLDCILKSLLNALQSADFSALNQLCYDTVFKLDAQKKKKQTVTTFSFFDDADTSADVDQGASGQSMSMDELVTLKELIRDSQDLYQAKDQECARTLLSVYSEVYQLKSLFDTWGSRFYVEANLYLNGHKMQMSSRDYVWAYNAKNQDVLCEQVWKLGGSMQWKQFKEIGLHWWAKDDSVVIKYVEKLARDLYMHDDRKNPVDCALLYIALGKQKLWAGLWRLAHGHPEQAAMLKFTANNFNEDRWKTAAVKNAYALLGKQRYEYAAAFFLLGGQLDDALNVCVKQMSDLDLALLIVRIYNGGDNNHVQINQLKQTKLESASESNDVWCQLLLSQQLQTVTDTVGFLAEFLRSNAFNSQLPNTADVEYAFYAHQLKSSGRLAYYNDEDYAYILKQCGLNLQLRGKHDLARFISENWS
ncbi:hypothetical protein MP228_000522 [Amoeboaphelidium protococcarum]|nr:hypothetical protein MP228_000522 [Amoeboaphelidium protococcarum]